MFKCCFNIPNTLSYASQAYNFKVAITAILLSIICFTTMFSESNTNLALTIGQMKSVTKAPHSQPIHKFHHFDNIAAIVGRYSNQSLFVKFSVHMCILQGFSYMLPSVVLWKIAALETRSFHFPVFNYIYCHTHIWLTCPA